MKVYTIPYEMGRISKAEKFKMLRLLVTFDYFGFGRKKDMVDIVSNPPKSVLIDSGVYSLISHEVPLVKIDTDEYVFGYIKTLRTVGEFVNVDGFFEFDWYKGIGVEGVEYYRKILEREVNLKMIPVWNVKLLDSDYLEKLCRSYDYVAIGGMALNRETNVFRNYIHLLRLLYDLKRRYNTKFHLLGMGAIKDLEMIREVAYSCDSSLLKVMAGHKRFSVIIDGRPYSVQANKNLRHTIDWALDQCVAVMQALEREEEGENENGNC